ncbi:nitronate monooxygenase [Virgibacillus soli]|uniref:NAD(P)H-dependent flavin oxidoreductase n=1 Tax=Lederbergia galactosidilytica TaxID=217031 RepID=UPI0007147E6D|nr:nitronate monooxygenase [Lederbergia galactosidilytica]KRG12249.1 nitronate monooxygenase [Virgibacillus soli]MBP1913949.1 nitronate monooxygenase [Lederbergia galactosidilytica]
MLWHKNRVTQAINIQYPIIQAGMAGGVTTPELVAAVSNTGALGTLGAGYLSPEQTQASIRKIKQLTNLPFGVNLFVPELPDIEEEDIEKANEWLRPFREELNISEKPKVKKPSAAIFEKQLKIIMEEQVAVCSFTFGMPSKEVVQELKRRNIVVIGTATTVKEAVANQEQGMDMVVVQGSEAGGHRGTFIGAFEEAMIGTIALVPQVVDHLDIPVIAAGGIMDGRGILAAMILGAEAVQMGTAFVTSLESGANIQHKEAILNSHEEQLVVTSTFSGKPARGIRNDFITKMAKHEQELPKYPLQNALTKSIRSEAAKQNRPEWMSLWCGQHPRLSKHQSASKLISDILSQIDEIMMGQVKSW